MPAPVAKNPFEESEAARKSLIDERYDQYNMFAPIPGHSDQRWPDFLAIGVGGAGIPWLTRQLMSHPEIWVPLANELHYFNERYLPSSDGWERKNREAQVASAKGVLDQETFSRDVRDRHRLCLSQISSGPVDDDWYGKIFGFGGSGQLVGEASTSYCHLPRQVIGRIVQRNPSLKVILQIRDPIDRAWLHINMAAAAGRSDAVAFLKSPTPAQCWPFVANSNYPTMLANWWTHVSYDRLIVTTYDDAVTNPAKTMEWVCGVLNIRFDERLFPQLNMKLDDGTAPALSPTHYAVLKSVLRPIYDGLIKVMPNPATSWFRRHYSS
jgi:hypothetical protein